MLSIPFIIYVVLLQFHIKLTYLLTYFLTYLLVFWSQYTCDQDKSSSRYIVHVADRMYLCDAPRKVINVDAANKFYNPRGTLVCATYANLCVVVSILSTQTL